jgi:hypothetical protein
MILHSKWAYKGVSDLHLRVKYRYVCQLVLERTNRINLIKFTIVKFNVNSFSGSHCVICIQRDRQTDIAGAQNGHSFTKRLCESTKQL